MGGLEINLIMGKGKTVDANPKQALGENSVLTLPEQDIERVTNKGGVATIMTPAGIMTTDSRKRGW